jgi:hypothetical protein
MPGWKFRSAVFLTGPRVYAAAPLRLRTKHGERRVGIAFEELDATAPASDIRVLRDERWT